MVRWLRERASAGDSIAQHGFQHTRAHRGSSPRQLLAQLHGHQPGEFVGLDAAETRRAVHAGWRVLKLAGIEPDGFVAPAYAYTAALRRTVVERFRWWAGLLRVHPAKPGAEAPRLTPAFSLSGAGPLGRVLAPALVRAGSLLPSSTLRLDLHPADLRSARRMIALEWVLQRAHGRTAVTYRELAGV
jgi:Uncharacterized protein conserved in bacteria (DUF2334)